MVTTKTINNASITYESGYVQRWLDGHGENVHKFLTFPGMSTGIFTTTVVNGSTFLNSSTAGEVFQLTTDTAEYDGLNVQVPGENFDFSVEKPFYFGARLKVSDASNISLLVGLCETQTDLLAVSGSHAINVSGDGCFFSSLAGTTTIAAKTYLDGVETNTGNAAATLDTDFHFYEIYFDGGAVYFYADNVLVTSFSSDLCDSALTVSLNFRTGENNANTAEISTIKMIQVR